MGKKTGNEKFAERLDFLATIVGERRDDEIARGARSEGDFKLRNDLDMAIAYCKVDAECLRSKLRYWGSD